MTLSLRPPRPETPMSLKKLIRSGANINTQDDYGNTALNLAVMRGQTDVINTLLINGADPDIPNEDGFTPTANASRQRREKSDYHAARKRG